MFTLAIDHGTPPIVQGSYAYTIWPEVNRSAFTTGAYALALARYTVWQNGQGAQAVYDATNNTLYAVLYDGNATKLSLPAALRAGWVIPPVPVGLVAFTYTNASDGSTGLSMTFAIAGSIISSEQHTLGHVYPYWWQTGAAEGGKSGFVPCSWPGCPGQWEEKKGYIGVPGLRYSCFANGTIYMENPPSQMDRGVGGTVEPIRCAFAE
jgi:hypothetical protein